MLRSPKWAEVTIFSFFYEWNKIEELTGESTVERLGREGKE